MIVDWPQLSDEQIESKAASFRDQALASLGFDPSGPVPVEQIAEMYLGYDFDFVEANGLLGSDIIGGIDFDSNTIIINSAIEDHIGRYSFTIAHEIGHHVLHRELFLKARSGDSIMCRGGSKRPIEEMQADRFAEALLVPRSIVVNSCKKVKGLRGYSKRWRMAAAADACESTGLNNVSVSAMEMRLMHLGLLPSLNSRANRFLKAARRLLSK